MQLNIKEYMESMGLNSAFIICDKLNDKLYIFDQTTLNKDSRLACHHEIQSWMLSLNELNVLTLDVSRRSVGIYSAEVGKRYTIPVRTSRDIKFLFHEVLYEELEDENHYLNSFIKVIEEVTLKIEKAMLSKSYDYFNQVKKAIDYIESVHINSPTLSDVDIGVIGDLVKSTSNTISVFRTEDLYEVETCSNGLRITHYVNLPLTFNKYTIEIPVKLKRVSKTFNSGISFMSYELEEKYDETRFLIKE